MISTACLESYPALILKKKLGRREPSSHSLQSKNGQPHFEVGRLCVLLMVTYGKIPYDSMISCERLSTITGLSI